MCGRAVYSARAISNAANAFSIGEISKEDGADKTVTSGKLVKSNEAAFEQSPRTGIAIIPSEIKDMPNASPGSEFHVFRRSKNQSNTLEFESMIWGLLPKDGTHHDPHLLPTDSKRSVAPHYIMFNARSETIYDKRSFSSLIRNGQTCVVAMEGYYEWTKSQSLQDKKKQPYFVCYQNKQQPMLMAGLWSCVKTGRKVKNADTNITEEETITTFTILTTDAHPKYAWLHPRQPVILWDVSIALEWLVRPSPTLVEKLRTVPIKGSVTGERKQQSIWETSLSVYPVSKKMNDGKYQGYDCTIEVKLEKSPSIKSFFSSRGTKKAKTETKVNGSGASSPHPASDILSLPQRYSPSKRKDLIKNDSSHPKGFREKSWTCTKCTFIHTGSVKFEYLACELCLTKRTNAQDSDSPQLESLNASSNNDADRGKKREAS